MTRSADPEALAREVAALATLDLDGLRAVWRARWGAPPPLRSVELLRLQLAWRMQAEALGGLDRDLKRQLARRGRLEAEGLDLEMGARLTRVWQGRTEEVVVTPQGFRWREQVFPSLSAAASAIAGSRWNGPRFFGLRRAREVQERRTKSS